MVIVCMTLENLLCLVVAKLLEQKSIGTSAKGTFRSSTRNGTNNLREFKILCNYYTLDIKNAFNAVDWKNVLKPLEGFCFPEYLLRRINSFFSVIIHYRSGC